MNKVNERCPSNCTPASELLLRSERFWEPSAACEASCLLSPAFLPCSPLLSLSPPSLAHREESFWEHTIPRALPHRMGFALQQATAGLCAWTQVCPKQSCCCSCSKHSQVQRFVINSTIFFPSIFFSNFFSEVTILQQAWKVQFYLGKAVWN